MHGACIGCDPQGAALSQAAAWAAVYGTKWAFEYFVVCKPLVPVVSGPV